jgi:DnaK suppressor protein
VADLAAQRSAAAGQVVELRRQIAEVVAASEGSNADDEHDPEGATIAFERQQLVALLGQAERRVAELDLALGRASAGTYGVCERCGEPIGAERLEARPEASTCIDCARRPSR